MSKTIKDTNIKYQRSIEKEWRKKRRMERNKKKKGLR
jgi:hypothetical protein